MKRISDSLLKISKGILRVIDYLCSALLIMIFFCMVIQIFCRTFSIGISWTDEMALLLFVLMAFGGAPLCLAEGSHIVVDLLVNAFHGTLRKVFEVIASAGTCVFGIIALKSIEIYMKGKKNITAVSMTWIKINWINSAIRISIVLLIVVAVCQAVMAILGKSEKLDILTPDKEKCAEEELKLDI